MINLTKIQNAIAESISNSTRPQISLRAPDIYSITALIASPDAAAIAFGPSCHVDGTTDNGEEFELSIYIIRDYSAYEVRVSNDPTYYGSECSQEDADGISEKLCELIEEQFPGIQTELIEEQFPGIQTELGLECRCSSSTTGPVNDTVHSIDEWIQENWTAAL